MIRKCLLVLAVVFCCQSTLVSGDASNETVEFIVYPKAITNFGPCMKRVAKQVGEEIAKQWPAAKRCPGMKASSLVTEPFHDMMEKLLPVQRELTDLLINIIRNCIGVNPFKSVVCIFKTVKVATPLLWKVLPPALAAQGRLLLGVIAVGPSLLVCEAQIAGLATSGAFKALGTFPSCMRDL